MTNAQKYAIIVYRKLIEHMLKHQKEVNECVESFNEAVKSGADPVEVIREIRCSTLRIVYLGFLEAINKKVELD